VGCLLQLSSSNHHYEVLVNGAGHLLLGRIEQNGKRVRLVEGADTEATWELFLQAVRNSERRI
jgi:hypothetical protein